MKLLQIFFNKILFKLIPISMQLSVQLHSEQITFWILLNDICDNMCHKSIVHTVWLKYYICAKKFKLIFTENLICSSQI